MGEAVSQFPSDSHGNIQAWRCGKWVVRLVGRLPASGDSWKKLLHLDKKVKSMWKKAKYAESSKSDSERAKNVGGTGPSLFSDTPEMIHSSIHKRCHIFWYTSFAWHQVGWCDESAAGITGVAICDIQAQEAAMLMGKGVDGMMLSADYCKSWVHSLVWRSL